MGQRLGMAWAIAFLILSPAASAAFEVTGLATPESFIVDPDTGLYYISNINGTPTDKDNNGFITKLDGSGKVVSRDFVKGSRDGVILDAPKGLDIIGKVLYVSDIDTVRGFDKETGKLLHTIGLKALGALFLNDLTHDDAENLYVSDTTGFVDPKVPGTIFKIETRNQNRASVFSRDPALAGPNGLVIHQRTQRLMAGLWDAGMIVEVGPDGRIKTLIENPDWKNLDGLDYDRQGRIYFSSFTGGQIYRLSSDMSRWEVIRSGLKTPADINIDRKSNLILVPLFNGNAAITIPIGNENSPPGE